MIGLTQEREMKAASESYLRHGNDHLSSFGVTRGPNALGIIRLSFSRT